MQQNPTTLLHTTLQPKKPVIQIKNSELKSESISRPVTPSLNTLHTL
jgi:hypothetical protein